MPEASLLSAMPAQRGDLVPGELVAEQFTRRPDDMFTYRIDDPEVLDHRPRAAIGAPVAA